MNMKAILGTIGCATCLAAALALSSSTTQGANLLIDAGFESGAPTQPNPVPLPGGVGGGWATFNGATFSTSHPEIGTYSLQGLQGAGAAWNFEAAYQVIGGVIAGQQFTLSGDYMTTTGLGSYAGAFIQLTFFDAAGTDLGTVETGGSGANALHFNPAANDTWFATSVTATAPAGAAYVAPYLAFMMDGSQASQVDLYWDNGMLTATAVPEPASFVLLGLGFMGTLVWRRRP